MHVSVAVVPPEDVVEEVVAAMAAVPGAAHELDLVGARSLRLPVIGLGNLTRPDATALCEALAAHVANLRRSATIGFAGVWALEEADDPTVALRVVGDVDDVTRIATALPPLVASHGFYVDRRRFVPRMTVARVTPSTTLPVLEALVEILEGYRSRLWEVASVEVVHLVHGGDGSGVALLASLPTT